MLKTFDDKSETNEIVAALMCDGGVIVSDQAQLELIDEVVSDLRPGQHP